MTKPNKRTTNRNDDHGLPCSCSWSNDDMRALSNIEEEETAAFVVDDGSNNNDTTENSRTNNNDNDTDDENHTNGVSAPVPTSLDSLCLGHSFSEEDGIVHPAFWDDIMETFQSMLITNATNDIVHLTRPNKTLDNVAPAPTATTEQQQRNNYNNNPVHGILRSSSSSISNVFGDRNNNNNGVRRSSREVNWIPYDEMELVRNPAFDMEDEIMTTSSSQSPLSSSSLEGGTSSLINNSTAMILPSIARTGSSVQRYLENVQLTAPTALSTWPSSEDEDDDDDDDSDSEDGGIVAVEPDVLMESDNTITLPSTWSVPLVNQHRPTSAQQQQRENFQTSSRIPLDTSSVDRSVDDMVVEHSLTDSLTQSTKNNLQDIIQTFSWPRLS